MVYYDVGTESFVDTGFKIHTGSTVLNVGEVTFGAPYDGNDWGDLFVSTTNNHVYRVDPLSGAAEDMGTIAYGSGIINISAGDLAFDNEENFYLLTVGSPPGKGIYLIDGWKAKVGGVWSLTGSQVRTIGDSAQYRGLAILNGGAGDWLGDNDTGGSPPDYIVKLGANDDEDIEYPMYLNGSLFDHGAGGDMSVGVLLPCPPYETALIAGQDIVVGNVTIIPFEGNLHVTYEITEPGWYITATHTHVAEDPSLIPQKNGNPIPGQFDYQMLFEYSDHVTKYTEVIPGNEDWCEDDGDPYLYIAAHVLVQKYLYDDELGNPVYEVQTGWGDGPEFEGKNWATYIVWEVCPCHEEEE